GLAGGDIPDTGCFVQATGGDEPRPGSKANGGDGGLVAGGYFGPAWQPPQGGPVVRTPRGGQLAGRVESHSIDDVLMEDALSDFLVGLEVEEARGLFRVASQQASAIRAEREGTNAALMREYLDLVAVGSIPENGLAIPATGGNFVA